MQARGFPTDQTSNYQRKRSQMIVENSQRESREIERPNLNNNISFNES